MGEVLVHDADGIRTITFNRPEKLNALRPAEIRAATAAVVEGRASARALVFRGVGRAFSAGVDVDTFLALTPSSARDFIGELGRLLAEVRTAPIPTLCVIQGYCLGGAFELALAADLRLATPSARFGLPEIKVGIPSVLDAALLERYVGLSLARELILTGDLYPVERFRVSQLLNRVVPEAELEEATEALIQPLAALARPAMRAQKALFAEWLNLPVDEAIARSVEHFAGVFADAETQAQLERYRAALRERRR